MQQMIDQRSQNGKAPAGTQFDGWTSNSTPTAAINSTGSNSCTITLGDNSTVAAIFY